MLKRDSMYNINKSKSEEKSFSLLLHCFCNILPLNVVLNVYNLDFLQEKWDCDLSFN